MYECVCTIYINFPKCHFFHSLIYWWLLLSHSKAIHLIALFYWGIAEALLF